MRKLKGFTLVEILIVIVIIGILIGALVPRMQSAQGRARDVARKNDLSQLQAAIVTSFQDKGEWPGISTGANDGIDVDAIQDEILAAGMNGVPQDPLSEVTFNGVGTDDTAGEGQYRYIVIKSYGSDNGAFALMAKTEVEGGSNWVVCDASYQGYTCDHVPQGQTMNQTICEGDDNPGCVWSGGSCQKVPPTAQGKITSASDVSEIKPCSSLTKVSAAGDNCVMAYGGTCIYGNESQLRYVLLN